MIIDKTCIIIFVKEKSVNSYLGENSTCLIERRFWM